LLALLGAHHILHVSRIRVNVKGCRRKWSGPNEVVSRIILEGVKGTMKTSARMTGESEYRKPAMVVVKHSAARETIKAETASVAEYVTHGIQF
jgi:hypothetical protein